MPPNRFESEVESFLEGSHGDRTHIKRADHPRLHHYAGRYCETFFAQHEAYLALCETKFALLTQNRRIWGVLRALGEFCLAYAANQLSRASLISPERCTAATQQGSHRRGANSR